MIEITTAPQRLITNEYDYQPPEIDTDAALVTLILHTPELSGLAVKAFVAIYRDPVTRFNKSSLATHLGASRPGMNKAVARLEQAGLLTVKHGRCYLVNILNLAKSLKQK